MTEQAIERVRELADLCEFLHRKAEEAAVKLQAGDPEAAFRELIAFAGQSERVAFRYADARKAVVKAAGR